MVDGKVTLDSGESNSCPFSMDAFNHFNCKLLFRSNGYYECVGEDRCPIIKIQK